MPFGREQSSLTPTASSGKVMYNKSQLDGGSNKSLTARMQYYWVFVVCIWLLKPTKIKVFVKSVSTTIHLLLSMMTKACEVIVFEFTPISIEVK